MNRIKNIDFSKFIPIIQKATDTLFVFAVDENPDFEDAAADENFICYPIMTNKEADFTSPVIFPKKSLDLLLLRIR